MLIYFLLLPIRDFFLYRLRGKDLGISDTFNRVVFWAIPNAVDMAVYTHFIPMPVEVTCLIIFCGLVAGFTSATIEHSPWQSPGVYNYMVMGLITMIMLITMTIPLFPVVWHIIPFIGFGMLGAVASWIGYSPLVSNRSLTLFGIQFCRPVAVVAVSGRKHL